MNPDFQEKLSPQYLFRINTELQMFNFDHFRRDSNIYKLNLAVAIATCLKVRKKKRDSITAALSNILPSYCISLHESDPNNADLAKAPMRDC